MSTTTLHDEATTTKSHSVAKFTECTEQHLSARFVEFQISAQVSDGPRPHHIVLLARHNFEYPVQLLVGIALRFAAGFFKNGYSIRNRTSTRSTHMK